MTHGQTSFNPGDIDAFAKYVADHVAGQVAEMTATTAALVQQPDLGEYDLSSAAFARYRKAASAQHDFVATLGQRVDQLVKGTKDLSRRYDDLEALNAARASSVAGTLSQEGGNR